MASPTGARSILSRQPNHRETNRDRRLPSAKVKRLRALLDTLSDAEYAVLLWLCEGKRNGEIASILHRSRRTVENHVASIIHKLEVETRGGAVRVLVDWHIATGTTLPWPDLSRG